MTPICDESEFIVIGAGIVGLATAWRLQQRYSDCKVTVLEAESDVAGHQSGHNSGVLHSGIYYTPGSKRAVTCRTGKAAMEAFCEEHRIAWDRCGKVIVATSPSELESLDRIADRARQNGVTFERLNSDQLREHEPNAAGVAGLFVPETGIVNYRNVCRRLAECIRNQGGQIHFESKVVAIKASHTSIEVTTKHRQVFRGSKLINCGGLQCDRIARLAGVDPEIRIVPFRGEYYELAPGRESLVNNLIYPVPNPSFPFLGVHFTRMIDGGVECGPNAVLAFSREGYNWAKVGAHDLVDTLSFRGFRKLASKHWKTGIGEMHRSLSKAAFVKALQKLMPCLTASDLVPGRSGVRAQAVSKDGELVDDFLVRQSDSAIHVLNAPSPAATASLAIAQIIVDQVEQ
ncbi:MAG: L-2-hydroxyglutarate oxidase [Planctomycetales bacterium]|nr:L-2-hydroxyglutarate oxidase [Planctomycetales bacterium]